VFVGFCIGLEQRWNIRTAGRARRLWIELHVVIRGGHRFERIARVLDVEVAVDADRRLDVCVTKNLLNDVHRHPRL